MEITNISNEINQVLAVLILCPASGEGGLGEVKDTIVAGEGAALVQRDGEASTKLGWNSRSMDSERDGSEQGGLAEHGTDATAEVALTGLQRYWVGIA